MRTEEEVKVFIMKGLSGEVALGWVELEWFFSGFEVRT